MFLLDEAENWRNGSRWLRVHSTLLIEMSLPGDDNWLCLFSKLLSLLLILSQTVSSLRKFEYSPHQAYTQNIFTHFCSNTRQDCPFTIRDLESWKAWATSSEISTFISLRRGFPSPSSLTSQRVLHRVGQDHLATIYQPWQSSQILLLTFTGPHSEELSMIYLPKMPKHIQIDCV